MNNSPNYYQSPSLVGWVAGYGRHYRLVYISGSSEGQPPAHFDTRATSGRGEVWLNAYHLEIDPEYLYRNYARLINHGRPRKVNWRHLNRQQKERALSLARAGLL